VVDYGRLIDEEKLRRDSAIAAAEARRRHEIELVAFFRSVEIDLGKEMAKANAELERRSAPKIAGPFRPVKDEETIELTFGARRPCCRLMLENIAVEAGLAKIRVELLNDAGDVAGRMDYLLEEQGAELKAYRPLVEGFPDRAAEMSSATIAQEIVPGIIRGRFL